MGWQANSSAEGFVVALVEEPGAGTWGPWLRELGPRQGDDDRRDDVAVVQAGCVCGWRGPRRRAYGRAVWHPYMCDVTEPLEDDLRAEWAAHEPSCPGDPDR